MSGFEIVGIILGVYPIVVTACQAYQAARFGDGYEKLIRRLDMERFLFDDFVSRLLGPDIGESQLLQLKKSTDAGFWQENKVQSKLETRHGVLRTQHILSLIKDSNDLLRSMQRELPGAGRAFEKQHSKYRFAFRNIKSNLSEPSSRTLLSRLKECNQDLQRLLSDHTSPSSNGPCRQPLPPSLEFPQRDISDVKHIYTAICNGYHCDCDLPHYANIELPQLTSPPKLAWPRGRTDEKRLQILFPVEDTDTSSITEALSNASIKDTHPAEPPPPYLKSALRLSKSDMSNSRISIISSKSSRKSRAISVRECADDSNEPIPDLCNFVKTFNGPNGTPGFPENEMGILQSEKKKYRLQGPGLQSQEMKDTMSLDELTNSEKMALPRGDRISLAVRLAYAIIQYYSTGWIDPDWTWKNFSVSGNEYKYSDVSQLFVAQKFYSSSGKASKQPTWVGWESVGEPRLTRLGFGLIELAMGKRLSEMRDTTIDPKSDPDAQDYFTAMRLLNTGRILREEGEGYDNVVRACIEHQFRDPQYTMRCLDSRDDSFHQDVEQCVLKPLHCMWKEPWGQSQRRLCF